MQGFRHILAQRHLAMLVLAAALLLKLLLPTGYMIGNNSHGALTLTVCSGVMPRTIVVTLPDLADNGMDLGQPQDQTQADVPCAFAGLSAAWLGAVDPHLLAALIAFVMAPGLGMMNLPPAAPPLRLRPPLRGPPILS